MKFTGIFDDAMVMEDGAEMAADASSGTLQCRNTTATC